MSLIGRQVDNKNISNWLKAGEHWVWMNAMCLCICLVMVSALVGLIFVKGFGHFWPADVYRFEMKSTGQLYLGELSASETYSEVVDGGSLKQQRRLLKIGNREDYGLDFKWLEQAQISHQSQPEWVAVIERHEWGNAYGRIIDIHSQGLLIDQSQADFRQQLSAFLQQAKQQAGEIKRIEKSQIGDLNKGFEQLRVQTKKLDYQHQANPDQAQQRRNIQQQRRQLEQRYQQLTSQLDTKRQQLVDLGGISLQLIDGSTKSISFAHIVRVFFPNQMGFWQKLKHYGMKLAEFVWNDPREANTEGGIFPAIFGTVVLVFLMTIFVTPLGVITAIYLREYAKQGLLVRLIRISVNNLAGVPSIVYGVFGLGFFVYFMGGKIDELFYPHSLPSPTFGSPNMLWASLTLALLTLPVVIVSTEEGLNRVPRSIREGSLALGATTFETIWRTVLPMTSPAIMTGIILAIARAAGEVAPLMLVGVVKLAPDLVIDSVSPFVHLDRQFMHLGFHIYDVGFQSPNVEAARPLVYATATLLILIIIALNLTAIRVRNRLRERYKLLES